MFYACLLKQILSYIGLDYEGKVNARVMHRHLRHFGYNLCTNHEDQKMHGSLFHQVAVDNLVPRCFLPVKKKKKKKKTDRIGRVLQSGH